jgi:glutamyl-tRNA synthetase
MMSNTEKPVRVRFAPSPTGHVHLGSARTALYNYLIAKKLGGTFILRIEDTDQKRLVEGAEQELIDNLHWLGIEWDEGPDVGGPNGPYHQSERKDIYLKFAEELIERDQAYYCFCTPERLERMRQDQQKNKEIPHYDGTCRRLSKAEAQARVDAGEAHTIRFKMPHEGTTTVHDLLRGDITFENRNLDDYILVKSTGLALYHLAATVDDHLMGITHVIRGSEWLPTFPLHSMIHRAFGWDEPQWVHLSIFLKPSGKGKMSKREAADLIKDGHSIFLKELRGLGYLPEAVINWVALMGWSYDDHTEFFTMQDLKEKFNLEHLNPSPAAINFTKLDHFNGLHIRSLSLEDLAARVKPFFVDQGYAADEATLLKIAPIIQERLQGLDDAPELAGFFFRADVVPAAQELLVKGLSAKESLELAEKILSILEMLPDMKLETTEPPFRELVEQSGLKAGQVFGLMRIAVTGQKVSPPLFESMEIIGKEMVVKRMKTAVTMLDEAAQNE